MTDFRMPSLGADMRAGTLVEWLVKPGDKVHRGDIVAIVETDKGAIEVEIFTPGVISDILVPVGAEAAAEVRPGRLAHCEAPADESQVEINEDAIAKQEIEERRITGRVDDAPHGVVEA